MFKREDFVIDTHPLMENEFRVIHEPTDEVTSWVRGAHTAQAIIDNACNGKLLGSFLLGVIQE
jgi:hypothetical protein